MELLLEHRRKRRRGRVGNINRTEISVPELQRDSSIVMLLSWVDAGQGQEIPILERGMLCFGFSRALMILIDIYKREHGQFSFHYPTWHLLVCTQLPAILIIACNHIPGWV